MAIFYVYFIHFYYLKGKIKASVQVFRRIIKSSSTFCLEDCVLLFGCGHADAFPVDVWVTRLMRSWFHVDGSKEFLYSEARRLLGPHCGLIQQALFHAARTGKIEL